VRWRVRPAADLKAADFVRLLPNSEIAPLEAGAETALQDAAARNRVLSRPLGAPSIATAPGAPPPGGPAAAQPLKPKPKPPAAVTPAAPAASAPATPSASEGAVE